MDVFEILDPFLKSISAVSGLCLVGLMLFRVTPRGRIKMVGLEMGPVFDGNTAPLGRRVAFVFALCVVLIMARTFVAII